MVRVRCQCLKRDGKQCTRKGSLKPEQTPSYCWQHQKCKQAMNAVTPQPASIPKTPVTEMRLPPFFQNSNQMLVYDLANGPGKLEDDDYATLIDNVVQGQWIVNLSGYKDAQGQMNHYTQVELYADGIKTHQCEWSYEGIVTTAIGRLGVFDHSAIKTMTEADMKILSQTQEQINRYKFGVYLRTPSAGEFEVNVCYDAKGKVVAIQIKFG